MAHAKTFAESLVVREQSNRVVEITTPWGTVMAYDRGVENVWIGSKANFLKQEQRGFPAPSYPASSAYVRTLDDTGLPNEPRHPEVAIGGTRFTGLDVTALFDVDTKATHRPTIANDRQCFVSVQYAKVGDTNGLAPYLVLVDLNTGTVTRSFSNAADNYEDFSTEEFILPTRVLTHRFMVIIIPGAGQVVAFAVRSIAWLSYRDHMAGHDADISASDAQRLLLLDPSLRRTYTEPDYDKAWFDRQVAAAPNSSVDVTFTPAPRPVSSTTSSPQASSVAPSPSPDVASSSPPSSVVPSGDWEGTISDLRGGAGTIRLSFSDRDRPGGTWSASFSNGRLSNAGALERLPGGGTSTATFYLHDEAPGCPYVVHATIVASSIMNASYSVVAGCPPNGGSFRVWSGPRLDRTRGIP